MSTTDFRRLSTKYLDFAKLQPRGNFHFTSTKYKNDALIIETPFLVTPTGIQSEDTRNWMDVELDVASNEDHQKLYDAIKSIDDRCIDETIDHMDTWFTKGNVDETFIEEQFKSPITSGWGNEPALLRFEIHAEHPESLMDTEGNVISPSDVTALSTVKVQMQLLGVWVSEKFLGCHWRAVRIVANLDHETSGRRRSQSPPRRAESPLPPVQARANPRRETSEPLKKREEVPKKRAQEQVVPLPKKRVEPKAEPKAEPAQKRVPAKRPVPKKVEAKKPTVERPPSPDHHKPIVSHSQSHTHRHSDEEDSYERRRSDSRERKRYSDEEDSYSRRRNDDSRDRKRYSDEEDSYSRRRNDSRERRRSYSDDSYER